MAGLLLSACHSSEKNYRQAYEKAMERRQTGVGAETYAKIEAERQRYTHVIDGDSVRMVYMNANVAIDSTDVAKPFNIVVATFTQRINAKSYRACARNAASRAAMSSMVGLTNNTSSLPRALTTSTLLPQCSMTSARKSASRSLSRCPGSSGSYRHYPISTHNNKRGAPHGVPRVV